MENEYKYRAAYNSSDQIPTGIYVRANGIDGWQSVDIVDLEYSSLQAWLRSRGEKNNWAEQVVYLLLGIPQAEIEKLAVD